MVGTQHSTQGFGPHSLQLPVASQAPLCTSDYQQNIYLVYDGWADATPGDSSAVRHLHLRIGNAHLRSGVPERPGVRGDGSRERVDVYGRCGGCRMRDEDEGVRGAIKDEDQGEDKKEGHMMEGTAA